MDDVDEIQVYDWRNAGTPVKADSRSIYDNAFETEEFQASHRRPNNFPVDAWDDSDSDWLPLRSGGLSSSSSNSSYSLPRYYSSNMYSSYSSASYSYNTPQPVYLNGGGLLQATDTTSDQDEDWLANIEEVDYSDQFQSSQKSAISTDTEKAVKNTDTAKNLEPFEEPPQSSIFLSDLIPVCPRISKPSTESSSRKPPAIMSLKRKRASVSTFGSDLEGLLGKVNCRYSSRTYAKPARRKDTIPVSSIAGYDSLANEGKPVVSIPTDVTTEESFKDPLLISRASNETDDDEEDESNFVKIRTDIFEDSQD